MGHAFQYTLMDILIRYNRMCGKETLWQMGTDATRYIHANGSRKTIKSTKY